MKEQLKGINPFTRKSNTPNEESIGLSRSAAPIIKRLSAKGLTLLVYIATHREVGIDYIYLDRKAYMQEYDIKSPATMVYAIGELIKDGYISRSNEQGYYWVNPNIFTL